MSAIKQKENSEVVPHDEAIHAVTPADSMVSMIQKVAENPAVPVEKMERMLDMQFRMMEHQAKQDFTAAMVAAQNEMPQIKKDSQNKQTNSTYAKLDHINKVITPIYTKHGFSLSFGTDGEQLPGCVRIVCEVLHTGGHSKTYTYDAPIDNKGIKGTVNKTDTHGRSSAISYSQRYLISLIFNLTLTDSDDDGNSAGGSFYDGDCVAAIQAATTIGELRVLWKTMSPEQRNDHLADFNTAKDDLK